MAGFKNDKRFKRHKIYRWIALACKLIAGPIFTYLFANLTFKLSYFNQTLGTLLSTTLTLVVYYGVIFFLNRYKNFDCRTSLAKSILIYTIVVLVLMAIESLYSGYILNNIYYLTGLGTNPPNAYISLSTVNSRFAYLGISFLVHFLFGYVTGILLYLLFKHVLSKE